MSLKAALEARGFDQCSVGSGLSVRVGCSQCEALVIQGIATHETGCPRGRRYDKGDKDGEEEGEE